MKIYIRKIDNQCIEKQISYTKEILADFLDNQTDHSTITCIGKTSGELVKVELQLATDPRFAKSMQKLLRLEGDLAIGDLMVMYKQSGKYIVELLKPTDSRHTSYLNFFNNDRHALVSIDDARDSEKTSEYSDIFEHNLYGIHIKYQNDALSEDRPHICIGWSAIGDLTSVLTKEQLSSLHEETWPKSKPRAKAQNVGQIWRFVKDMNIGDYVVFADGDYCHIGRISSDYYFDNSVYPNQSDDYTNIRNVEWLKTKIQRNALSESFHRSLMTAMSVWGLNDYKSAVYDLLNETYVKDEIIEDVEIEEEDIFVGFASWLVSYNNPDYTGREKYTGYPRALERLTEFMKEKGLIEDSNLNDKNLDKFKHIMEVYIASDEAKAFDHKLASESGIAALRKYIKYIECLLSPETRISVSNFDYASTEGKGVNKIFFGTPGCGKSYHIEHNILGKQNGEYSGEYKAQNIIRTTFYQDYSNIDFIGQILPKIARDSATGKDIVEYIFNPGPFTLALIRAISAPSEKVALVVEEINRGNAPAIFGDVFQLLDRDKNSISEYGIVNVSMMDYLNNYEFEVDGEIKKYIFSEIKIPGNMDIFATMNTSDQNVYTLDTAFVRRWDKEKIKNSFTGCAFKNRPVPGMPNYSWQEFVVSINNCIARHLEDLQVNEDKQIGAFFVKETLLVAGDAEKFAYKVFDYLWGDVAKLDHSILFNTYETLEALIEAYVSKGVAVFKPGIFNEVGSLVANGTEETQEDNDNE